MLPPVPSGPQISHTEKSNAGEWNIVQTSDGPNPKPANVFASNARTFAWDTVTPLGLPVDPLV